MDNIEVATELTKIAKAMTGADKIDGKFTISIQLYDIVVPGPYEGDSPGSAMVKLRDDYGMVATAPITWDRGRGSGFVYSLSGSIIGDKSLMYAVVPAIPPLLKKAFDKFAK